MSEKNLMGVVELLGRLLHEEAGKHGTFNFYELMSHAGLSELIDGSAENGVGVVVAPQVSGDAETGSAGFGLTLYIVMGNENKNKSDAKANIAAITDIFASFIGRLKEESGSLEGYGFRIPETATLRQRPAEKWWHRMIGRIDLFVAETEYSKEASGSGAEVLFLSADEAETLFNKIYE